MIVGLSLCAQITKISKNYLLTQIQLHAFFLETYFNHLWFCTIMLVFTVEISQLFSYVYRHPRQVDVSII